MAGWGSGAHDALRAQNKRRHAHGRSQHKNADARPVVVSNADTPISAQLAPFPPLCFRPTNYPRSLSRYFLLCAFFLLVTMSKSRPPMMSAAPTHCSRVSGLFFIVAVYTMVKNLRVVVMVVHARALTLMIV